MRWVAPPPGPTRSRDTHDGSPKTSFSILPASEVTIEP